LHKRWPEPIACGLLNDADFLLRQAVELIDKLVDLPVGGVNLPLDLLTPLRMSLGGKTLVEGELGGER